MAFGLCGSTLAEGRKGKGRESMWKYKMTLSGCLFLLLSDAEHQQADWVGIHERICQRLVPIRTPTLLSLNQAAHIEIQFKKVRMYVMHCRHMWKRTMKPTVQHRHPILSLNGPLSSLQREISLKHSIL